MPQIKILSWAVLSLMFMFPIPVCADQWEKINDTESLSKIYSDTVLVGEQWPRSQLELNYVPTEWQIENCQDGTGQLTFKGHVIPRTWRIKGRDQVCIATVHGGERCYRYERHLKYDGIYRNGLVGDKTPTWVFRVTGKRPAICDK